MLLARSIVSVVCFTVHLRYIEPFVWDLVRASTWPRYVRILVHGHYLFRKANSFRSTIEENFEIFGNTSGLQNWEISLGYSLVLAVNFRPTVSILTNSQLSLRTWLREHSTSLILLLCPGYVFPHGWRCLKIQVTRQKYDIPWYTTKMFPITILNHAAETAVANRQNRTNPVHNGRSVVIVDYAMAFLIFRGMV